MATFPLKVMTIDHCFFEGDVDRIVVRTSQGDVGILPNHVPYIAALGIGALIIIQNGEKRIAAIAGGFVDVTKEGTTILARSCEWADEIDVNRDPEKGERARIRGGSGQAEKGAEPYPYCRRQVNMKKVLWERSQGTFFNLSENFFFPTRCVLTNAEHGAAESSRSEAFYL